MSDQTLVEQLRMAKITGMAVSLTLTPENAELLADIVEAYEDEQWAKFTKEVRIAIDELAGDPEL